MFSGFKFRTAKNLALMQMELRGIVTKEKLNEMRFIAGAGANAVLGKTLISTGAATSKHAAAAAVFARIADAAQRSPTGNVSADDWRTATRFALINAGASEAESTVGAAELIGMHRKAAEQS